MLRSSISAVLVAAAFVGCSAESTSPVQTTEVGTGHFASTTASVWKPSSRHIEVSSFGYWMGSFGYTKERVNLTAQQLLALESVRTTSPPTMEVHDMTSYLVRVLDEDGSVDEYRAALDNVRDSDEGTRAAELPTIDIKTLEPFLSTFDCVAATATEGTARQTDAPLDPAGADLDSALPLPHDPGCINGVHFASTCGDAIFAFDVREPQTFDIIGGRCVENLSLRVYAEDRTKLLAESTPGAADTCFSLRRPFDVGRYVFVLSKTNARGCAADGIGGDTSLRIQPVD